MSSRATVLLAALSLCGCFHPVDECRGIHCPKDAGPAPDGGTDAGMDNDDAACPLTNPSLTAPCATVADGGSGVIFDGESCDTRCFTSSASVHVFTSLRQCAFACALDNCKKGLLSSTVTATADCAALRVSTTDAGEVSQSFALPVTDADGGVGCNLSNGDCVLFSDRVLGDGGLEEACAASLLPSTTAVTCDPSSP